MLKPKGIVRLKMDLKALGYKLIRVEVLSRNLKGKTDLHGNPYKPTEWIFTAKI